VTSPNDADAHNQAGIARANQGRFDEAIESFRLATLANPSFPAAHNNLGNVLLESGRQEEAVAAFERAIHIDPAHAGAHQNLGVALTRLRQFEAAVASLSRAIALKPDFADAHNNLGIAYAELQRMDDAIASYKRALQLNPGLARAHNNLGNALRQNGALDAALDCYARAIQADPRFAEAYNNLGLLLRVLRRGPEALESFKRAVQANPRFADAHSNLGVTFADLRQREQAIESFTRALELEPDHALARSQRMHQLARLCDWDALAADADKIETLGLTGGIVPPFAMLSLEDEPARHRVRAERFAAATYPLTPAPDFPRPAVKPKRLRIGYFSADISNHAMMYLLAGLFEAHDRDRFELYAYSLGPPNNDAMRARVEAAFDIFRDVGANSDQAIAGLARADAIDIAVDLNGYTERNRLGIFAQRAAAVQINYLGYPGTSCADFMDYIIADRTIIPAEARQHYSERIIYLPHAYQANDDKRVIAPLTLRRADFGLPDDTFVFCCFNNSYKITPAEFDIWMPLLAKTPGSVLWLLAADERTQTNLRTHAARRGVDPSRLVFAAPLPLAEHLARHALADLFLDTFNYNAHTTASDALWAGLPLVTMAGRGFAARVAASLLTTVGLPELIAEDKAAYAQLAFELATDKSRLDSIRRTLKANRVGPPFDTKRFTRQLESGYRQAYDAWRSGAKVDTIDVSA